MKRAFLTAAVLLGMVASVSAGNKDANRSQNNNNRQQNSDKSSHPSKFKKQSGKSNSNQDFVRKLVQSQSHGQSQFQSQSQSQGQNSRNIRPSWKAPQEASANNSQKRDKSTMGRPVGDGRVMTAQPTSVATLALPVNGPQAQAPKGYVWNNGHWERAKANGTSVSTAGMPLNAQVNVRQHPTLVQPTAARDSRGGHGHRGYGDGVKPPPIGNNGTVTVTDTVPVVTYGHTVTGSSDIGIKDIVGGIIKIHDPKFHYETLPPWGFEARSPINRDHRTKTKNDR